MAFNNTPTAQHKALLGHTIDKNRLQFVSVLGLGAYGVVYLAKDVSASIGAAVSSDPSSPYTGRGYYAVKCLNKTGLDARQRGFQRREIALHTLASSHPNIVSLHRVVETSSVIYVILSFCPDGDLFSMITDQSRYLGDDDLIRSVFLQIVDAVAFCHKLGIYHRDLKPENILCDQKGKRVLLADFGLATTDKMSSDFGCGSTFYMSPECQGGLFERNQPYSSLQNDVWSLGVILVNLTCGRNPWKQAHPTDETFRAYLENHDFLPSILPVSPECNHLLKRIFTLNPAHRISMAELRETALGIRRWTITEEEALAAQEAQAAAQEHQQQSTSSPATTEAMGQDSASSQASFQTDMTTDTSFGTHESVAAAKHSEPVYTPTSPRPVQQLQPALPITGDSDPFTSPVPGLSTPKARREAAVFALEGSNSSQGRGGSIPSPAPSSAGSSSGDDWSMPPTPNSPCFLTGYPVSSRPHQVKRYVSSPFRVQPPLQKPFVQQTQKPLESSAFDNFYSTYESWAASQQSPSVRSPRTFLDQRSPLPGGLAPPFEYQQKQPPTQQQPSSPSPQLRPQHRRQRAFVGIAQ